MIAATFIGECNGAFVRTFTAVDITIPVFVKIRVLTAAKALDDLGFARALVWNGNLSERFARVPGQGFARVNCTVIVHVKVVPVASADARLIFERLIGTIVFGIDQSVLVTVAFDRIKAANFFADIKLDVTATTLSFFQKFIGVKRTGIIFVEHAIAIHIVAGILVRKAGRKKKRCAQNI